MTATGLRVLLLGGTAEARELARLLQAAAIPFESSLAGRVADPRLPVGPVRTGGFGGVDGLRAYLRSTGVTVLVDATHPFAEQMTRHAHLAATAESVRYVRLERPGWSGAPGADTWHWVDSHAAAAQAASRLGRRPMLTIGRRHLAPFLAPLADHAVLVRVVDPPEVGVPANWRVVTSRGPYTLEGERTIMAEHHVDVVVTKDSGGSFTWPKLQVAAERGIAVVVVRRTPLAHRAARTTSDPAAVLALLRS